MIHALINGVYDWQDGPRTTLNDRIVDCFLRSENATGKLSADGTDHDATVGADSLPTPTSREVLAIGHTSGADILAVEVQQGAGGQHLRLEGRCLAQGTATEGRQQGGLRAMTGNRPANCRPLRSLARFDLPSFFISSERSHAMELHQRMPLRIVELPGPAR